jgi:hypothetical protein
MFVMVSVSFINKSVLLFNTVNLHNNSNIIILYNKKSIHNNTVLINPEHESLPTISAQLNLNFH